MSWGAGGARGGNDDDDDDEEVDDDDHAIHVFEVMHVALQPFVSERMWQVVLSNLVTWSNLCPRTRLTETALLVILSWGLSFCCPGFFATFLLSSRCHQVVWVLITEAFRPVGPAPSGHRLAGYRRPCCMVWCASASTSARTVVRLEVTVEAAPLTRRLGGDSVSMFGWPLRRKWHASLRPMRLAWRVGLWIHTRTTSSLLGSDCKTAAGLGYAATNQSGWWFAIASERGRAAPEAVYNEGDCLCLPGKG